MFVTLIEANNEYLVTPARGLLEVISTDAAGHVTEAYFSNVSPEYPTEPAPPVPVKRPVFIYSNDYCKPTETPVTPQEVLTALRFMLRELGPEHGNTPSVDHAYDLIERIERNGIVGANKDMI